MNDNITFKFKLEGQSCHCSHCLPEFWNEVNKLIIPDNPIGHEGKVKVNLDNAKIILEQHESGPEIVVANLKEIVENINPFLTFINSFIALFLLTRKNKKCYSDKIKLTIIKDNEIIELSTDLLDKERKNFLDEIKKVIFNMKNEEATK